MDIYAYSKLEDAKLTTWYTDRFARLNVSWMGGIVTFSGQLEEEITYYIHGQKYGSATISCASAM